MSRAFKITAATIAFFLIGAFLKVNDYSLVDGSFLTVLGILNGSAIAVILFILSIIHDAPERTIARRKKLSAMVQMPEPDEITVAAIRKSFDACGTGIRGDAIALIVLLAIAVGASALARMDLPRVHWPTNAWFTKVQFVHGVWFVTLGMSLWCVYDVLQCVFLMSRLNSPVIASENTREKEEKKT